MPIIYFVHFFTVPMCYEPLLPFFILFKFYLPSHKDEFITELGKCTPPLRQSTIDRKAGSMKMLDLLATKGTWGKGMLNPLQELLPEFNSFLDAQEEYVLEISPVTGS